MTTGVERLRPVLAEHLPQYESADIRCLGAGVDHVAYLVGNELIVRLAENRAGNAPGGSARQAGCGHRDETEREARLLRLVARHSTVPVPEPLVVADRFLAYRVLPGVPVFGLPQDWRQQHSAQLGAALGRFLASLRTIPADDLAGTAERDAEPMTAWLADARACWVAIGHRAATDGGFPPHGLERIEVFLAEPPPSAGDELCFSHNDLGAEHLLVDPSSGQLTGVIDWTDAAISDPAVDLGLILRDLGVPAARRAARQLPTSDPDARRDRSVFYARCRLLEDVRFGIETGRPEYVLNSVAASHRLFAG